MANVNSACGFRPVRLLGGGADIRASEYAIADQYNASIFTGDVVQMTGTGRNIAIAAGGNVDNIGVFAGCKFVDSFGRPVWSHKWVASTTSGDGKVVAYVWDDPNLVFEVQADSMAEGDIGKLFDWDDGTGVAATGLSGRQLANASAADADKSVKVLGLSRREDNAYGAYAKVECLFIEHVLRGVIAGVGGI